MTRISRRSLLRGLGLTSLGVVATTQGTRTAMAVSNWEDTTLTHSSSDGTIPSLQLSASDLSFEFAWSNFPSGPTTVDVELEARSPSHNYDTVFSGSFSVDGESGTKSIDGTLLNDVSFPVDLLAQDSISKSDFTADAGEKRESDTDFRVVFSTTDTTTTVETTCTVAITNTSSTIPDSVIAHWEFDDDTDTTTAIDSENGYALSLNGSTYTTTSQVGSTALSFDATDDTADAGTSLLDESGEFTLCGWVNRDSTGVTDPFINNARNVGSGEFMFGVEDSDTLRTINIDGTSQSNYFSSLTVGSGTHTFVGFAFDGGSSATFKVDDQTETVSGGTFGNLSKNWAVGYLPYSTEHLGGDMDDWFVANSQLSNSQMEDLRNRGL